MNSNEDKSIDARALNGVMMNNVVRLPVSISTASHNTIHDAAGDLLDFWGDEGVCSLGYNTPELLGPIMEFFASGQPHQLPDIYPQRTRTACAEMLVGKTGMDRIFFTNSGAEANETMIKMARRRAWVDEGRPMESEHVSATAKRHVILTVAGNFHGRTAYAMSAADYRVSPYHRFGYGPTPQGFGVIDLIDGAWMQVVTDGREHAPRLVDWEAVAAVTLAPVLGNNLVKTYPASFWSALRALRIHHDVPVMFDDVQAGAGRCGEYATWQIPVIRDNFGRPDVMCLGKGIAMGFPMSVVLATERMAGAFEPGVHFNTFGGSPFVCHMALAYFAWLDRNMAASRDKGALIRNRLLAFDWVDNVDGAGMLNAFQPKFDELTYDGYAFVHRARDYGLSIVTHRAKGPIRFTPPMNVSEADLHLAFVALQRTHESLSKVSR